MSQPINTVHGPLYIARQSVVGTPATTKFKKYHMTSGNVVTGKEAGKVDWIDSSRFADSFDYTASLKVSGKFIVKGSADAVASILSYALGTDLISGASVPYVHTINPTNTLPYLTIVTEIGQNEGQIREHSDILVSSVKIDSSSDSDVVMAEVEVVGMTPGKVRATLPTIDTETEDPFLHYDAENTFIVAGINSGTYVKDISQCAITVTNEVAEHYGDAVTPTSLILGKGQIVVDFTLLATNETLPLINNYFYGRAAPANGAFPTSDVFKESFSVEYSKGTGISARSLSVLIPELVFTIEDYPEVSADGSPIEIACTGEARIATGDTVEDIITVEAETADNISYTSGASPDAG